MYISKLELSNYLCHQQMELTLSPGINFFVGNNNAGKTSILRALSFLRSGLGRGQDATDITYQGDCSKESDLCSVTATIAFSQNEVSTDENDDTECGRLLGDPAFDKLARYLIPNESVEPAERIFELKVKKSAEEPKKILVLDPSSNSDDAWANVTGIPALFQRLFDPVFVWAEDTPETVADFSPNKTLGKLVSQQLDKLKNGTLWTQFKDAHEHLFSIHNENSDDPSFADLVQEELNKLKVKLDNQYGGDNLIRFNFAPPSVESFTKQGEVMLTEENGIETSLNDKGTGMQRAFALAVIELLAEETNTGGNSIFCLDEPTTYLHPKAQIQLARALEKLGIYGNQLLVTTHSPYMLRDIRDIGEHRDSLFVLRANDGVTPVNLPGKQTDRPRSLAEITYYAFNIPTIEYHIELFGDIYQILNNIELSKQTEHDLDAKDLLINKCGNRMKEIAKAASIPIVEKDRYDDRVKMQCAVKEFLPLALRNMIDHPCEQNKFSDEELAKSISIMLGILKYLRSESSTLDRKEQ